MDEEHLPDRAHGLQLQQVLPLRAAALKFSGPQEGARDLGRTDLPARPPGGRGRRSVEALRRPIQAGLVVIAQQAKLKILDEIQHLGRIGAIPNDVSQEKCPLDAAPRYIVPDRRQGFQIGMDIGKDRDHGRLLARGCSSLTFNA